MLVNVIVYVTPFNNISLKTAVVHHPVDDEALTPAPVIVTNQYAGTHAGKNIFTAVSFILAFGVIDWLVLVITLVLLVALTQFTSFTVAPLSLYPVAVHAVPLHTFQPLVVVLIEDIPTQ